MPTLEQRLAYWSRLHDETAAMFDEMAGNGIQHYTTGADEAEWRETKNGILANLQRNIDTYSEIVAKLEREAEGK